MSALRCPLFAPHCAVCLSRVLGGVPAREPDCLIKWFIGFAVIAVGANLLSGFVVAQNWALASAGCLCCGAAGRCAEYRSAAEGALSHNAGSRDHHGRGHPVTDSQNWGPIPAVRSRGPRRDWVMVSLLIGELAYGFADRRAEYVRIGVLASSLLAGSASRGDFPQLEPRLPRPGRNRGTRQRRRRHSRPVRGDHACHDG
jgi:hypothetical protein